MCDGVATDFLSLSEEDDEVDDDLSSPVLTGTLSKWTNYIHGWQCRFFVLKDCQLSYYKSELDTSFGCRGAISIDRVIVQIHDFDDCRFDISVNDCVWYLRADNADERQTWLDAIETFKAESGFGSQGELKRHGSLISLTSNKSLTSISSKKGLGLREKVAELETFRDILSRQIDTLQRYFDHCADVPTTDLDNTLEADDLQNGFDDFPTPIQEHCAELKPRDKNSNLYTFRPYETKSHGVDFKGEALTFKATTAGVINTLYHCIELFQQREEAWRRRLEREIERRKKVQETCNQAIAEARKSQKPVVLFGGPDYEEGPHSALNEEEWHDAVDAALERQDKEDERFQRLLSKDGRLTTTASNSLFKSMSLPSRHKLFPEIDSMTSEQLHYAQIGVEEGVWQLFAEDGEMKMFKREVEIDGLVCDPLKAVHTVKGVTAFEYCHYFFEPQYKMDWDTTLEQVEVLERISDDSMIFRQLHKRVWPASQRESLFWSHMRRVVNKKDLDGHDAWIVCNHDTSHDKAIPNPKIVRVGLTVAMLCQTIITAAPGTDITRDNLTCKIIYVAQVNPGGWAPSSVLRAVYKREYPKFLKRFTQYVLQKTEGQPVCF